MADVLDALRSKRIYKDGIPLDVAMEIIMQGRGTQFDPELVDILFAGKEDVIEIYRSFDSQPFNGYSVSNSLSSHSLSFLRSI